MEEPVEAVGIARDAECTDTCFSLLHFFRQLYELQSKLVTLNQAVCEAWGELTRDNGRGA